MVVGVAVDHDCRALRLCGPAGRCIDGVELEAAFAGDRHVLEDTAFVKRVVPLDDAGVAVLGLGAVGLDFISVF